MTFDTLRTLGTLHVMVMLRRVKYWCHMAFKADAISNNLETCAMRFVTICARDSLVEHLALEE